MDGRRCTSRQAMKNTSAAASGDTGSLQPPHNEMVLFPLLVGTNAN